MSSIKAMLLNTSTMTTGCVTHNEIFDNCNSTTAFAKRFLDREELSNERMKMIPVKLPNGQLSMENWKSFEGDLEADGLELTARNGRLVYVSGYPPRNDYNVQREVSTTLMKYRYSARSKSFPR